MALLWAIACRRCGFPFDDSPVSSPRLRGYSMRLIAPASALLLLFTGACAAPNRFVTETNTPPASVAANGPLWHDEGGGFAPSPGSVNADVPCRFVSLGL